MKGQRIGHKSLPVRLGITLNYHVYLWCSSHRRAVPVKARFEFEIPMINANLAPGFHI